MKRFFLSISVIASFVLYSFVRQYTAPTNTPAPVTDNSSVSTPEPTITPAPTKPVTQTANNSTSVPQQPSPTPRRGAYRDGSYTGQVADAFYGNIQVQAVISGGKLTDVKFLQYPNDRRTSIEINSQAMPMLRQEAIQAQSANVDVISGASDTSSAFIQSLGSALQKAKV
jgi:uncharacterized protein with FMN-binding domain